MNTDGSNIRVRCQQTHQNTMKQQLLIRNQALSSRKGASRKIGGDNYAENRKLMSSQLLCNCGAWI